MYTLPEVVSTEIINLTMNTRPPGVTQDMIHAVEDEEASDGEVDGKGIEGSCGAGARRWERFK